MQDNCTQQHHFTGENKSGKKKTCRKMSFSLVEVEQLMGHVTKKGVF